MPSGDKAVTGLRKDMEIIKEVIDEIHDDTADVKQRVRRLEQGQDHIIATLDHIVAQLEGRKQEEAATTLLLQDHGHRIARLEAA